MICDYESSKLYWFKINFPVFLNKNYKSYKYNRFELRKQCQNIVNVMKHLNLSYIIKSYDRFKKDNYFY